MTTFDIEAVRFRLRDLAPYFGRILWKLRPVEDKNLGFVDKEGGVHGTFAVTANAQLIYNPNVDWSFEECVGALCHEIHHLVLKHHSRCNGRNPMLWNMATDLAINTELQVGGWKLPTRIDEDGKRVPNMLLPGQFNLPENQTAEFYYNKLMENAVKTSVSRGGDCGGIPTPGRSGRNRDGMPTPGGGDCGSVAHGRGEESESTTDDGNGLTDVEIDAAAKGVAEEIMKSAGNVPNSLKQWAHELLHPTIPWQNLLRGAIKRCVNIVSGGASDYSFMRSDDRRSDSDLILPKLITYKPEVACYVDTSGSISKQELVEMVAEVHGVVRHLTQRISVSAVDAAVHETYKITTPSTLLHLPLSGGGGTDMGEGLIHADKVLRPRPNIVVIFTDGYNGKPWPDNLPRGMKVIVCLTSAGADEATIPSWATTVRVLRGVK